ncbi:MAG: hypothetical protein HFH30_14395, partial [Eubacterium sp.]|nr:hypothetical protein [Eubacterium sp.]
MPDRCAAYKICKKRSIKTREAVMTILDEIAGRTRERIAKCRQQLPLHELRM